MEKLFRCPFCLHEFTRSAAKPRRAKQLIPEYLCPNPGTNVSGNKLCGMPLPLNFFDANNRVIAIVGRRGVGKTYYLLALLMQLKKNLVFQKMGFSGMLIGDDLAMDLMKQNISNVAEGIPITPTFNTDRLSESALVVDLSIVRNDRVYHVYLSFFDTPGEIFKSISGLGHYLPFLFKADGLLLLTEPMQIKYLRPNILEVNQYVKAMRYPDLYETCYNIIEVLTLAQRTKSSPPPPAEAPVYAMEGDNGSTPAGRRKAFTEKIRKTTPGFLTNTWSSIQQYWQQQKEIKKRHKKIACPVAVGITKIDQIDDLLYSAIPHDYTDVESMYFQEREVNNMLIDDISAELRDLVFREDEGEIAVKNLLESMLKKYAFFGIKACDVDPESGNVTSMGDPQGVLLPLIWLLSELKLYKA